MDKVGVMGQIFGWLSFVLLVVGLIGIPFGYGMEPLLAGWTFLLIDVVILLISAVLAVGWAVISVLISINHRLPPNTY